MQKAILDARTLSMVAARLYAALKDVDPEQRVTIAVNEAKKLLLAIATHAAD